MPKSTEQPDAITFTISDLAKEFGITTRAIRFYEDQGLLTPRRDGRKRIYSRRDRTRLKLTLRGKRLGLSLNEIREIIGLFNEPKGEERQLHHLLKLLDNHRAQLEQQRLDVEAVLAELDKARQQFMQLLEQREAQDDPTASADAA